MSTTILCYTISATIMIAPTSMHKLAHPEGEIATASAAAACNTIMVYKRRNIVANLVQRAERNGYKGIVLTADTPRLGRREAGIENRMIVPQLKNLEGLFGIEVASEKGSNLEAYANETFDATLCWKDVD